MKKKLMTISDLYQFCLNNKFEHFSSNENDKVEIVVEMPAVFEKSEDESYDDGLYPFKAAAYHDHVNLNKSEIAPEVLQSTLPSAMLKPILANIIMNEETGIKDFGSHDMEFVEDENGNTGIKYIEQPVGVIYGNNSIEYDDEAKVNRAILHGYVFSTYCHDAIDILERRGTVACSVELAIKEMSFDAKNGVLSLDDFVVEGLTLLGENVKPGMSGSNIQLENFSKKEEIILSEEVNSKLYSMIEELSSKIDNLYSLDINNTTGKEEKAQMEKENMEVTEVTEVDAEEIKVAETTDEEVTEVNETTDETETEETPVVDEKFDDGDSTDSDAEDSGETEVSDDESEEDIAQLSEDELETSSGNEDEDLRKKKMTRTYEISHDDIRYGLYELLKQYEEANNDYYGICTVYDSHFIFHSWFTGSYYGQKYKLENDNVSFDGEMYNLHAEFLTDSEKTILDEMRSNYSSIAEKLAKYESEPEKMQILNSSDYENIADSEEFIEFKKEASHFDMSVDEVKAKADSMLLEFAKKGTLKFSVEEKKVGRVSFASNSKGKKSSKYGNLFNK